MAGGRLDFEPAMAAELNGVCNFAGTKLGWVSVALGGKENLGSPLNCILNISRRRIELTPASEKLTGNAVRALLAPMPLASLMDEADAKDCLKHVEKKVVTRAAKRKAEAAAAAAAEEARLMQLGAMRAAKRAAIAARLPSTNIVVDNALRVYRY